MIDHAHNEMLAVLGGPAVIRNPHPHNDLCAFTDADKAVVNRYVNDPHATLSYFGCEGELAVLEQELAEYFGQQYCVCTNSGTSALHSAYFGLGLEPGDEVIGSVNTFLATVTPLLAVGAVPVLADVEADTGNIDPADVMRKMTDRTRAVVVTHHAGHPVELDPLLDMTSRKGIFLVEDVSLAVGSTYRDVQVGSFGHVAAVSLGATKLLSGGQGGAMVTSIPDVKDRANLLGHFARRSETEIENPYWRQFAASGYGHNYRMHPVAVAIARAKLGRSQELISKRHARYERLMDGLAEVEFLRMPTTRGHVTRGQWQYFIVDYDEAAAGVPLDVFAAALSAEGAEVEPRGPHPLLHEMALFQSQDDGYHRGRSFAADKRVYSLGDFPVAERIHSRALMFPMFLHEEMALVDGYVQAVRKVAACLEELSEAWPERRDGGIGR